MTTPTYAARLDAQDWPALTGALDARGHAVTAPLLTSAECREIAAWYEDDSRFRSRVVMERHTYGEGEYRYFSYPLPDAVAPLRAALYARLAPLASDWAARLGGQEPFPPDLASYTARCHAAGQTKPTPLLLRYETGGYNRLHQDLYGDLVFPLQAILLLSAPEKDFDGGEFVLVEQRPRAQSRVEVVPLAQGAMVIFAVRHRPATGARGTYRVALRHGVSRIRRGRRFALGLILHDAG
jgi:hypothetical protein